MMVMILYRAYRVLFPTPPPYSCPVNAIVQEDWKGACVTWREVQADQDEQEDMMLRVTWMEEEGYKLLLCQLSEKDNVTIQKRISSNMNFLRVILWIMMSFVQEALTWIVAGLKFSASFSIRSIQKKTIWSLFIYAITHCLSSLNRPSLFVASSSSSNLFDGRKKNEAMHQFK